MFNILDIQVTESVWDTCTSVLFPSLDFEVIEQSRECKAQKTDHSILSKIRKLVGQLTIFQHSDARLDHMSWENSLDYQWM